jgi:hypothetical protein
MRLGSLTSACIAAPGRAGHVGYARDYTGFEDCVLSLILSCRSI